MYQNYFIKAFFTISDFGGIDMKKVLIVAGAFAVAIMITLSSYAACPCTATAPCCETPKPCCEMAQPCCQTPAPCECVKPDCTCCHKYSGCNSNVIDLDKACEKTSYEIIAHSRKLSKFERIVKQACMEDYLECGNYIALVPTNCALKGLKFKCPDAAKKFVLEHLADAKIYPNELCTYSSIKTLCGKEFCVTKECDKTRIGRAVVIVENVKTQNGRIYILDRKLK